jgi:hypothetical protein
MHSGAYLGWLFQTNSCQDCVPPLRKPCDVIRSEFRGAGIQFSATQRFARRSRRESTRRV